MRVVSLIAENFKILKAVEIRPGDGPVVIGGDNEQGKSSVMDAIWVALAGRAAAPPVPIRKGEEECRITLDVGEYVVHRKFTAKEGGTFTDTIKLLDDRGRIVPKPHQVLGDLLGAIGFDPFDFTKLDPEKQAAQLLQLVPLPIDLEEFATDDARDYATRRDRNRDAETTLAQISAIPAEEIPDDLPDRDALVETLGNAANTNGAIEREKHDRERAIDMAERIRGDGEVLRATASSKRDLAATMVKEAEQLEEAAITAETTAVEKIAEINAMPKLDEPVDTDKIRQQIRDADEALALVDRQRRRAELVKRHDALAAESAAFTKAMQDREAERRAALAKAKMPVEGLSFAINEKGKPVVTLDDLPFSQASTAAQLRASTAIAMAANPELRVLRIKDGSLLDAKHMAVITEMALAEDFQLWIEIVGDGPGGIIIENGEVKSAKAEGGEEKSGDGPAAEEKSKSKPKAKAGAEGPLL